MPTLTLDFEDYDAHRILLALTWQAYALGWQTDLLRCLANAIWTCDRYGYNGALQDVYSGPTHYPELTAPWLDVLGFTRPSPTL